MSFEPLSVLEPTDRAAGVPPRIGFDVLSYACLRLGVLGRADGRWLRPRTGYATISEPITRGIFAVRSETPHQSRLSMRTRERLIYQYIRERNGVDVAVTL